MAGTRATPVRGAPLPYKGADGLFSQSWFPLCLSDDVPRDSVKGFSFLDGRVVVFATPEAGRRCFRPSARISGPISALAML